MSSASSDPAISEHAWERSIDDPFSADAVGLLHHIAHSPAAQRDDDDSAAVTAAASEAAVTSLVNAVSSSTSTRRFSPLTPRSRVVPLARRVSAATPASRTRASIYEEDDDGRQPAEDNATALAQAAGRKGVSSMRPLLAASPQSVRVNIARAEDWLRGANEQREVHNGAGDDERGEHDERQGYNAPSTESFGGFTTGSSRPVSVSALSLERARRLMAEADEEHSSHRGRGSSETGLLPQPSQRSRKQLPSNNRSFTDAAAISVSPSSLEAHEPSAARLSHSAASPLVGATIAAPQSEVYHEHNRHEADRCADGGMEAGLGVMAGFATGSGRKVTVNESSLRRAHQLVREAEEEEADRHRRTTPGAGSATELVFKSVRSHQQRQHSTAVPASLSTQAASSHPSRPPPSTFRPPARIAPRHQPLPSSPPPSSSHAAARTRSPPTAQPLQHTTQHSSRRKPSKSADFDAWLKEQSVLADEADMDGMPLLPPPPIDADDLHTLVQTSTTTTLATFGDDDLDSALLSSLPSTEGSVTTMTSSPSSTSSSTSASTDSSQPSTQLLPKSCRAVTLEGFGGFVTGANVPLSVRPETLLTAHQLMGDAQCMQQQQPQQSHEELDGGHAVSFGFVTGTGMKAAAVRPESLLRAQRLMADAQQQPLDMQQEDSGESAVLGGFVTRGGKKTAALRPESLLRAEQLLAHVDATEQREGEDKENRGMETDKPILLSSKHRPPLAVLSMASAHARPVPNRDETVSHGVRQPLSGSKADMYDNQPLLTRRQVGRRLNEGSAVERQRSPLADSPLPSPVTALLHVTTKRVAAIHPNTAGTLPSKKRKLTFNTPRAVAPGSRYTSSGGSKAKQTDSEQTSLLALRGGHKQTSARQTANTARGASAAVAAMLSSLPPAHLPLPPTDVLQLRVASQRLETLSRDELLEAGLASAVVDMTSYTALTHTFTCRSSDSDNASSASAYSASTAYYHLLDAGCDRSLLSALWVRNHYRWIVWKLACLERSHPALLKGRCCTYYQVMAQLRKRYTAELELVRRPALAKLLEQDESAARYMILCVAAILPATPATNAAANVAADHTRGECGSDEDAGVDNGSDDEPDTELLLHRKQYGVCHLELTDGWYSVAARLDAPLLQQLQRGRIRIGDKLRVFNASLAGASEACTPLENESAYVELHANSTRRATANRKLGLQRTATFSVCLASVREGGGAIPCLHAAVARAYPIMYMEVMEDGTKVHRNQRAEDAQQEQWERRIAIEMEQKRADWEQKLEQGTARSLSQQPHMSTPHTQTQDGQPTSSAAASPTSPLSSAASMELQTPEQRRVVAYLKARLCEIVPPAASIAVADGESAPKDDGSASLPAVLTGAECTFTVWRPTEDDMHALTEGNVVSIYSAQVAGRHDGLLRLSSSRSTPILINGHSAPLTTLFRRLCPFSQLRALQRGDEFDIAVCAVYEQRYSSHAVSRGQQQHTRQLYCCYDSDELLMIDVKEDDSQRHFTAGQPLRTPTTLLACSLRYSGYDSTHRVHTAQSSPLAALVSRPALGWQRQETDKPGGPRHAIVDGWRRCGLFFSSNSGKAVAALHRQRAAALVEGVEGTDGEKAGRPSDATRPVGWDSSEWSDALYRAIAAAQTEALTSR